MKNIKRIIIPVKITRDSINLLKKLNKLNYLIYNQEFSRGFLGNVKVNELLILRKIATILRWSCTENELDYIFKLIENSQEQYPVDYNLSQATQIWLNNKWMIKNSSQGILYS